MGLQCSFSDRNEIMERYEMITKKLYLESIESAYLEEFTAEVIAIEGNKVVLDQTLFYPLGEVKIGTLDQLMDQVVK